MSAAVTTVPACGVERTHYSALQTVRTPTLSATHHNVPAHNTTLRDMPSKSQLDKSPSAQPTTRETARTPAKLGTP